MASLKDTVVLGKLSILGNTHTKTFSTDGSIGVNGSVYLSGNIYHNDTGRSGNAPSDGGVIGNSGTGAFSDAYIATIHTNAIQGKDSANNACFIYPTGAGWQLYNNNYSGNLLPGSNGIGKLGADTLMFNKTYTQYLEVLNINKYLGVYSKSLSATTTKQLSWSVPIGFCGMLIISSKTEYAIYYVWYGDLNTENYRFQVCYSSFKSTYLTPTMEAGGYIYAKMSNSSGNQTIYAMLLGSTSTLTSKANAGIS